MSQRSVIKTEKSSINRNANTLLLHFFYSLTCVPAGLEPLPSSGPFLPADLDLPAHPGLSECFQISKFVQACYCDDHVKRKGVKYVRGQPIPCPKCGYQTKETKDLSMSSKLTFPIQNSLAFSWRCTFVVSDHLFYF